MNDLKFYGYAEGVSTDDVLTLEEVTIAANPSSLRSMAVFFERVADLMELHGEEFDHEHFSDFTNHFRDSPSLIIAPLGDKSGR